MSRHCAELIFSLKKASSLLLLARVDAVNLLCCNYSGRWIDRRPEPFFTAEDRCQTILTPLATVLARSDLFSKPSVSYRLSPQLRTCLCPCSKPLPPILNNS